MKNFERVTEMAIERAEDAADGEFTAILATSGEASDGHILSVKGMRVAPKLPLLFNHKSEAMVPALGTVRKPVKSVEKGLEVLRVTPKISMDGDGVLADIRRGVFQLVKDGALPSMSVRWEGKGKRRIELKPDHPAFVDSDKLDSDDFEKRFGLFFANPRALEGSVVALGADPKALVGRAQVSDSEGERVFFNALARSMESNNGGSAKVAEAFAALTSAVQSLRELEVQDCDIASLIDVGGNRLDLVSYEFLDGDICRRIWLPRAAWESLRGESLREMRAALALTKEAQSTEQPEGDEGDYEPEVQQPQQRTVADMAIEEYSHLVSKANEQAIERVLYSVMGKVK